MPYSDDAMPASEFNKKSSNHLVSGTITHLIGMGVIMGVIGLSDAMTGGMASATMGDIVLQTAYGAGEMLMMGIDAVISAGPVVESAFENAMAGNWMPSGYESTIMSHDGMVLHEMAPLTGHESGFGAWVESAASSGDLGMALEDAGAAGISLEEYYNELYGHASHG